MCFGNLDPNALARDIEARVGVRFDRTAANTVENPEELNPADAPGHGSVFARWAEKLGWGQARHV